MRTKEEISKEIEKLRGIEPRVRPRTIFGNDNKGSVHVQIKVLEKDMSEDDIYDVYEHDEYILENALYARYWLDEKEDRAPSAGWKPLCL